MKLSDAQKWALRLLHNWGDCEVRAERDSISAEGLTIMYALQGHEYLQCHWGPLRIIFCLTDKGCEAARKLEEEQ